MASSRIWSLDRQCLVPLEQSTGLIHVVMSVTHASTTISQTHSAWALTAGRDWDDLKQYPDSACSTSSLKLRKAARELEKELKEKSGELKLCSRLDTTIVLAVQQMVNYKKEDPNVQQLALSLWGNIKHLVPEQKKKAHGHKDKKVRSGSLS
jgi:hypothetical protein